jgi:hypothetical protein
MLVGRFALRSWVLNVVTGFESGAHRLVRSGFGQNGGCLRKSTTQTVLNLVAVGKNGTQTARLVGWTSWKRPVRLEACAALAQALLAAK